MIMRATGKGVIPYKINFYSKPIELEGGMCAVLYVQV